ncbi:GNAT family N-acetyltransferase [Marinobacter bohaiensis]|uniref:GNAT family N-acetyltransferase n=1 Tax=Marinobacter bohaiensis TaxID=2201898 RepID=UPI000DAF25A4|nr:GNAT family N-acetyltransferase [Marinobacter bohaiensis]
MDVIKATPEYGLSIAELALIAGEGVPGYFWEQARQPHQSALEYGAEKAAGGAQNFSYRNVHLAMDRDRVAGMLLAYRLPDAGEFEDLDALPDFIRPLVELEQRVPGSYYINMLATYPAYRHQGIGSALMARVDGWAIEAGCELISIQVFEKNEGAVRLYRRLGYMEVDSRPVVGHPSMPHDGRILLLIRRVGQ